MKPLWVALLLVSAAAGAQPAVSESPAVNEPAPVAAEPASEAASWPRIVAIQFSGNETTQEVVMLREMLVAVGDSADPKKVELSRQYVQDLGLFSKVRVSEQPGEGGVVLTFTVEERWYILPYPRFSVNVEGQSSTGLDLRWANVFGLNHNLRFNALQTDRKIQGRGKDTSYSAGYSAPYVFDSPYRVSFNAGNTTSPAEKPVPHDETFQNASLFVSRTFRDAGGARSQGHTFGMGLAWQREDREGEGVPEPYGQATALTASYSYRNLRYRTYSEEGVSWRIGGSFARNGVASDYSYQSLEAGYDRHLAVGNTKHQSFTYTLSAGFFSNAPQEINVYSYGGSSVLRGYPSNSLSGNAYYLATMEFFRPVYHPSLRIGAILEAGKVFESTRDAHLRSVDASLGLGIRFRMVSFVALEIELGYAIPLSGGPVKLFGGRV